MIAVFVWVYPDGSDIAAEQSGSPRLCFLREPGVIQPRPGFAMTADIAAPVIPADVTYKQGRFSCLPRFVTVRWIKKAPF